MARVVVEGAEELKRVAAKLRKVELVELTKETRKAQREAIKPIKEDVQAEAATLPSGYRAVMAKSIQVNIALRQASFYVTIKAKGKAEERDLREVNRGILRHPLFGRRKPTKKLKKVWFITRVKPGFVDRPIDRTISRVVDSTSDAISAVLQEIARA